MKILTWRDEWTLGIDTLDDDHRQLVDLLLGVAQCCSKETETREKSEEGLDAKNDNTEDLYTVLERFGTAARRHFQREEEFIRTIDCPGLPDHQSEHALLMAELTDMVRDLRERGVNKLSRQDLEALKQWVIAHILGADRKFAEHYFEICH